MLEVKAVTYIGSSHKLCWVQKVLLNIRVPVVMAHKQNDKNSKKKPLYTFLYYLALYFIFWLLLLFGSVLLL